MGQILEEHPNLCYTQNPERDIEEVSNFLSETFGGDTIMRTMIMRNPLILDSDIPYLQHQITQIFEHLFDGNHANQVDFVLDIIRKQPMILTEDIEKEIIPKILFLKQSLSPIQITDILINASSVILMSFHRLIRIAFIQQKTKKISMDTSTNRIDLEDFNVNEQNLHYIEKYIDNDGIWMYHILQFQPIAMVKVFKEYNAWLIAQIQQNYYFDPLLKINEFGCYSEPILNLIDDENDDKVELIEGKTNDFDDNDGLMKMQKKRIKKTKKSVRQLELLVGDVYKANTFKNALFG